MKKLLFFAIATLFISVSAVAQEGESKEKKSRSYSNNDWMGGKRVVGEGPRGKQTRDVRDFVGLESGISADIFIKQGSDFNVTVEGQKNVLDLLTTEVVNGIVKVRFEKGYSIDYKENVKIYVTAPDFDMLGMSGSGDVVAETALKGDKLKVYISGSGDFKLNGLDYTDLNVSISGSGDVDVSGKSDNLTLSVSGSGDVRAGNLKARTVRCNVSGSGDIVCNAVDALDASVSGSGDILYSGSPASVKTRVTGSGDIRSAR